VLGATIGAEADAVCRDAHVEGVDMTLDGVVVADNGLHLGSGYGNALL
jgi:hypothetical protein